MKCREDEVTRFAGRKRNPHRLRIPHFADDNHVRSPPERRKQGRRKIRRVDSNFYLLDNAFLLRVLILDWIFNGDNVLGVTPIDFVDEGGQGRSFSRTGRTTD